MTHAERLSSLPILVVDDEPAIRTLFARALTRAGFRVIEATSGVGALEAMGREQIAVLVIDNHMPTMGGIEAVRRLRANEATSAVPIILVTGSDEEGDRVAGLEAGANDFVSKSTPLPELVARVRAQLRSRVAWADLMSRALDDRARMVGLLGSVVPTTPEETAGAIIEHLSGVPGLSFIGLVAVESGAPPSPLATWSPARGVQPGASPMAPALAEMLVRRTMTGPWMDRVGETLPAHSGVFDPTEVGFTAIAPLLFGDRMVGFLTLGVPVGEHGEPPGPDLLAAAIDYAGVASAILGPGLGSRDRDAEIRTRLEVIVAERRFHALFQPIVALKDRRIVGFEALSRFDDEVPPELRFAEAARASFGQRLEEAVITEILRTSGSLPTETWLGVNVSPTLVLDPGWLEPLLADVSRDIVLELTEHAQIQDYVALRAAIAAMRPRIQVAVDDAGAGHSSLRHILELSPEYVKLDISLVRGIDSDDVRQALVAGLAYFASRSGSTLIAEGIESEAEARMVRGLGVSLGQGFLFGRPDRAAAWAGRGTA